MANAKVDSEIIGLLKRAAWEMDPEEFRGVRRFALKSLQFLVLILKNFWLHNCLLRCSALAFTTILSLVPLLALAFAILKGFGVQNQVEPLVLEQLSGGSQEVAEGIIRYINNTNMRTLGVFGLLTLLITAITLLDNVEDAFNSIWGVKATRSFRRKFSDYLSVLISGPILIFTAVSVTTFLESQTAFKWLVKTSYLGDILLFLLQLLPYLVIWIALTLLYLFIPNTAVRFRSALVGAIIAGTFWQLAQWWYIHFQVGVSKYNAIYGTLAVLPIFMVWIYVSWLIVLLGVEIVYAHQNMRSLRREMCTGALSHRAREILSLAILADIVTAFVEGTEGWTAARLEDDLDVSDRVLLELVDNLVDAGLLVATVGSPTVYRPAREPDMITVGEVLDLLKNEGDGWQPLCLTGGEIFVSSLLADMDSAAAENLSGMTLRGLANAAGSDAPTLR
ncbi:MAG TPA: YhjD/YihY/BrkB family envelope integrity protein [Geobacteraceae bacterium]|nr:YhjD/YihY/BrkB family envelope integrity protein [Geobacteraceae bacterium]